MVDLNNKKVLITGGCGFIGSNFIELISKEYENVTILNMDKMGVGSRSMLKIPNQDKNKYIYLKCDIQYMNYLVNTHGHINFDYIFHFAAESHVDRSINSPLPFIQNNVMGMISLLEWVREYQPQAKVMNISTDEVYGHLTKYQTPFTEYSKFAPRSPYSASKASADLIAESYTTTYGLNIITTHCCNNFGPHQADEKFIPIVIKNIVRGEPIPVYGTGENIREWIHVDDHNKSLLEIAKNPYFGFGYRHRYNIGSGVERSNLEMIREISEILKIEPNIQYVGDRKGHDFRYAINTKHYIRKFKLKDHNESLIEICNHYSSKYSK
jgi:dTDP-glucose 4,6-dehydratase